MRRLYYKNAFLSTQILSFLAVLSSIHKFALSFFTFLTKEILYHNYSLIFFRNIFVLRSSVRCLHMEFGTFLL